MQDLLPMGTLSPPTGMVGADSPFLMGSPKWSKRVAGERGEWDWGSPHGAGGGGVVRQTRCTELLPCVGERRCQQNGALTHGCGERTFNLALMRAVRGSASCDSQCPPGPKQWRGALGTPWGLFLIQRTGISPG